MPQSAIAAQIHKPLDVHGYFGAQLAFDFALTVDNFTDIIDFGIC